MPTYPAIEFIVKHGKWLAVLVALLPPAAVSLLVVLTASQDGWHLLSLAMLPVSYLLARSYIEVVTVIADMLMPK